MADAVGPSDVREVPPYWLTGASGYEDAVRRRQASSAPLVLYFFTDWCPYCKAVDRDLFSSAEADRYMSRAVVRVRINPEEGDAERRLADQFHVTGYPTFLVLPASSTDPQRCSLFREGRDRKPASPQQLQDRIEAENLRNAQRLIREGYERRRAGDPAGAVALLDQAVAAAPQEADGWLQRAYAREEQGALDGALADYGIVALLRKDSIAHERAVYDLLQAKRFDEAVACATEWMEREPRGLKPVRQRAWAHHQRGDEIRAREDAQRCCALGDHAACAVASPIGS
ncbi:MAG TPA: thioredoxin family protein [Vicinamibacteria bacterium]|nr:thioredoxin family protein [Vicinamibacteria bacterium]